MSACTRFKIRFMQPDEASRIAKLISDLQTLQQMVGKLRIPNCDDVKRELSHRNDQGEIIANNKGTFIAVAVDNLDKTNPDNTKIVGYLMYTQAFSIVRGRHLYLNSFFIEEPYRQHGLGSKFIKFMMLHAKLLDINQCDVGVMNYNERGQKFYKRYGAYLVQGEYHLNISPV